MDHFIEQPEPSEVERSILANTRLDNLIDVVGPGVLAGLDRARIVGNFENAARIATEPSERPRFVFVHVPAPHPPWVFGPDGSPRDPSSLALHGEPYLSPAEQLEAGFDQATHVGNLTVEAIDRIVLELATPPVIVVMSDHGPMGRLIPDDPAGTDFDLRASSFMAALAPGHPGLLADRPTPVNLFPTLFDAYLGMSVARQPDSIWSWHGDSYLDAYEVPPIDGWTR